MTDDERSIEDLFYEARALSDASERGEFLARACGSEVAVRARVEALLRADEEADSFLSEPATPANRAKAAFPPPLSADETAGMVIGPYKLLQEIGQGGFGTVFMAEQERPVRRKVALKIIKLGIDTRQVVARFEAERQALALMEHPNIAKVLDAGATEAGRPYFVMEYVRGISITEYCDTNNLNAADRLRLFIPVCNAVQHAHQKGVIHRDLKPSNILVTLHDGRPVPKVIDFGIAKATSVRLTEKTFFTEHHQLIGTPAYMSPEQAEMSGLDVDMRTDVYSLGVLLYELLTGTTPFETRELMKAGYAEMQRIIREVEPARPSTRISTLGDSLSLVASNRKTEPKKLGLLLRGDLDWMVMKCLEKDRNRRYETPTALATDVQRHLDQLPVSAGPPSRIYTLRKFVRRNRGVVGAGLAVVLALAVGFVATFIQYHKARTAHVQAAEEAARATALNSFMQEMLGAAAPGNLQRSDFTVREMLDLAAAKLENEPLYDSPRVVGAAHSTIGQTYEALGLYDKAETHLTAALRQYRVAFGADHADVAVALDNLANLMRLQGKATDAEPLNRDALAMNRRLFGENSAEVALSINNLAALYTEQGRYPEAETLYREALGISRRVHGERHTQTAIVLGNLAHLLWIQTKLSDAEPLYRESLALKREVFGEGHPEIASSIDGLATLLADQGKLAEAEVLCREALEMYRKLDGDEHPDVAYSWNNLAVVLAKQGKLAEAEGAIREALGIRRQVLGEDHPSIAASLNNLGAIVRDQGKPAEAVPIFREALALRRQALGDAHPGVVRSLTNLASLLVDLGDAAAAEPLAREAVNIAHVALPEAHPERASAVCTLGSALAGQAKSAEAEPILRECLEVRRQILPTDHWKIAATNSLLGGCLTSLGRYDKAEPLLLEAHQALNDDAQAPAARKREAAKRLVALYEALNKPDRAAEFRAPAAAEQDNSPISKTSN